MINIIIYLFIYNLIICFIVDNVTVRLFHPSSVNTHNVILAL